MGCKGLINKAAKDFSNKATGGWCCSLDLPVNTSNIRSDNEICLLYTSDAADE